MTLHELKVAVDSLTAAEYEQFYAWMQQRDKAREISRWRALLKPALRQAERGEFIDGRAVPSCSVSIASLEGATITTIEGLAPNGTHPVQRAWLAEQVTMCGFCEPGFIMAIAALLQSSPSPTKEQIDALPNICRCGAYPRILKAIARAAAPTAVAPGPAPFSGKRPIPSTE